MATSTMLPSSPIYVPSTASNIEDWLTSLRRDSPASRTLSQDTELVPWILGICGLIPSESLMKWDQQSCSWKTSQASLLTGMQEPWSGSWPPQGMTLFGVCFQQVPLEHLMLGHGGGVWPTPTATERPNQDGEVTASEHSWEKFRAGEIKRIRKTRAATLTTAVSHWPTPRANLVTTVTEEAAKARLPQHRLEDYAAVHFPRIQMTEKDGEKSLKTTVALNPRFVEWLMGLPIGWTDSKPLEMESCLSKQPSPLDDYSLWFETFQSTLETL